MWGSLGSVHRAGSCMGRSEGSVARHAKQQSEDLPSCWALSKAVLATGDLPSSTEERSQAAAHVQQHTKKLDLIAACRSNPAREAFVEMCKSDYVQKMTFDSYLYKTVVPGNPLDDAKLAIQTIGSLLRGNALRQNAKGVSFGSRQAEQKAPAAV